jgi:TfoX/Sxy family transcriptional regulator of competence genes
MLDAPATSPYIRRAEPPPLVLFFPLRSMAKQTAAAPADKVTLYEKLIATNPRVKRKGAMMPYTSLNGNMFTLLNKEGVLLLRLSDADREAFVAKYKTKPVVMYGTVMPEYVAVPDDLLAKTAQVKKYFDASFDYVSSLRAKPTKKKPKK